MTTPKPCPNCGQPLPASALAGLCPACMLKVGALADSVPEPALGPNGTVIPPSPDPRPLVTPELGQPFGRYHVLRRLGHGGMGVVYEAEETDSGRRVALKVIQQKLNSPQDRARFLREGRLAASINHPNCVYVYGTEEIEGTPVIAMEFVTGGTLQQQLASRGPLPVDEAVDAMLQVIEGLEAAHAMGILHRDIKPSNCFKDEQGTVKIGDFGLSISTLPRAETNLTESGTMVGTPAYCSPEQLRGEELNVRSDMYAVGVTLFQLLIGRPPFEGQTMPQLIANTLEKRPVSPRQIRKDIPTGLARVILRCLEKQPSERYRRYADLRRALEPYSSAAPTPATLGLRFLAGLVDLVLLSMVGQAGLLLVAGDPFTILDRLAGDPVRTLLLVLPLFALVILYYALTEWRWGATAGKALCRLRVLRADRNHPTLPQALLRAALFVFVPVLPYWIALLFSQDALWLIEPSPRTYALSVSYYVIVAVLFVSARRRNGFAALHDLASQTRVVSRAAWEQRHALTAADLPPAAIESRPRVGPYHVLEPLGTCGEAEWAEGYDLRLLRRVLLRQVPPGTPPLPAVVRQVSRPGRLRWLSGRRDSQENWDAFEGAGGQPLVVLAHQTQPWREVRFWLHDLAAELSAAEQDGSMPSGLALDRVWITREGRAKLLDFPAPGTARPGSSRPASTPVPPVMDAKSFMTQVALAVVGGQPLAGQSAGNLPGILPLHARRFLETLPALAGAEAIAATLQPLLRRAAEVTRLRRAVMVIACAAFPLFMTLAAGFGLSLLENWQRKSPELMELSNVLNIWRAKRMPFMPADQLPDDRLTGIYIAAHYAGVITNEPLWSSTLARTFIRSDGRAFAERSLEQHASATVAELEEAEQHWKPFTRQGGPDQMPALQLLVPFLFWFSLLMYVVLPAVLAALVFRGGMVLLATGVTFVRRDGRKASRLRLLWRSVLTWSPIVGAVLLGAVAMGMKSVALAWLSGLPVTVLIAWSLWLPQRGLPDRLAGTWPVPR